MQISSQVGERNQYFDAYRPHLGSVKQKVRKSAENEEEAYMTSWVLKAGNSCEEVRVRNINSYRYAENWHVRLITYTGIILSQTPHLGLLQNPSN